MRRSTVLFAILAPFAVTTACQDEEAGYDCTATYYDTQGGSEIGTMSYSYGGDDIDAASAMCLEDAEADKPDAAMYTACSCASK